MRNLITLMILFLMILFVASTAGAQTIAPFVYDGGTLPTGKSDFKVQPNIPASQKIVASEWNSAMQSIYDTRTALTGGLWHGFDITQAPPAVLDGGISVFAMDAGAGQTAGLFYETPDAQVHQLGSGWQTAIKCDLTTQATQAINADGSYTFCGLTWANINTAHAGATHALTNGTGLQLSASSTSNAINGGQAITAPGLWTSLSTLIPSLGPSTAIRFDVDMAGGGVTGAYCLAALNDTSGVAANTVQGIYYAGLGASNNSAEGYGFRQAQVFGPSQQSWETSSPLRIELPGGLAYPDVAELWSVPGGGAFTENMTTVFFGRLAAMNVSSAASASQTSHWGLGFYVQNSTATGSMTCTFKKFQVLYKN